MSRMIRYLVDSRAKFAVVAPMVSVLVMMSSITKSTEAKSDHSVQEKEGVRQVNHL